MFYQLWTFGGLLMWYGDLWDSAHSSCNNAFISFLCQVHHCVTNSGLPCRGKASGCFVSDLCPFCQKSQSECTLWTLQCCLLSAQAAFLFSYQLLYKKKNLEWESWGKAPPQSMEAKQEKLQGFYKAFTGQCENERRKKKGGNRKIKRKIIV